MNEDKPSVMPPVPPFVRFVASAVPMVFDDSLSYYEALCALWKYVQGMTDVINNNATLEEEYIEKFNELKTFVDTYFDNLDVQEEINNKLDAMVEDGTLQEIIASYLNSRAVFGFDTVADMKASTNLIDGSYARTMGYRSKNDEGGGLYKIRSITNDDVVDEAFIIEMGDPEDNLIAELILNGDEVNVKQCGAYGDGTHDDSSYVQLACNKVKNILIPTGSYKLNTTVTLSRDTDIYAKNAVKTWSGDNTEKTEFVTTSVYAFTCSWGNVNNFTNLSFDGYGIDTPCGSKIDKCEFTGTTGINNARACVINECSIHNCTTGILKMTDCIVKGCYIYSNTTGLNMNQSNSNNISSCKIEWNNLGVSLTQAVQNIFNDNIFDRNTTYAIDGTSITHLMIIANMFLRNLTMHLRISGNIVSIQNNSFFSTNSEDDQSGTVLPTVALSTNSISNTKITNNVFTLPAGSGTSKLFNEYPSYQSNVLIEGNTLNGQSTDVILVNAGTFTSSTSGSASTNYQWSNLNYMGVTGWMMRVKRFYLSSGNSEYSSLYNLRVTFGKDSGIYFTVINDDTAREYTCYAEMEITNKYSLKV